MRIIGLTGGIGSGKSVVAEIFRKLDIPVLDADKLARSIMEHDEIVQKAVIKAFGEESYLDGELNRAFLAKIVFRDPYQLQVLNSITHPRTIAAGFEWAKKQNAPYVVKEAALFFESGSAEGIDKMIGVTAPKALRIQRVMKRDNIDREDVLERMSRQIDDKIKMRLCDWVIVNDEQEPLLEQVLAIHEKLLN
ncbi:MAG: dephospho-CoA kinase [Chitinophagaceae bacterium]|nr:dephospho-CoA kinase [Chitinophagaceae bacterium]